MLNSILTEFYPLGVRKMVTQLKKSCPGCLKLNKKSFLSYKADMPDVLKSVQPPFSYCQADIFSPIFADNGENQLKHWVWSTYVPQEELYIWKCYILTTLSEYPEGSGELSL